MPDPIQVLSWWNDNPEIRKTVIDTIQIFAMILFGYGVKRYKNVTDPQMRKYREILQEEKLKGGH